MTNIQPTVDHIGDDTLTRELRNLASQVDKNENALNQEMASISQAQQEVDQKIAGFQDAIDQNTQDITTIENNINTIEQDLSTIEQKNTEQDTAINQNETAIQNEVTARQNAITAEQKAREDGDVTGVDLSYNAGAIAIQLTREEGNMQDSVTCPFIKTATLVPTSTERAFKIQFEFQDGTQYDTNEFLIPEGGGTDVSVTGVTVVDGTAPDSFQVQIQLSDGEPLKSNDYTIDFPAQVNTYPTAVNMSLSGTTLNVTIVLNNGTNVQGTANLSGLLTGYATQEWVNGQLDNFATEDALADVQEQLTNLGISSSGNQMSINGTNAPIVNSISGTVADGKLKISVNGVESGDIPLPESSLEIADIPGRFSVSAVIGTATSFTNTEYFVYNYTTGGSHEQIGLSKTHILMRQYGSYVPRLYAPIGGLEMTGYNITELTLNDTVYNTFSSYGNKFILAGILISSTNSVETDRILYFEMDTINKTMNNVSGYPNTAGYKVNPITTPSMDFIIMSIYEVAS